MNYWVKQKLGRSVTELRVHLCAGDPHIKVATGAIELIHELLSVLPDFWRGHQLLGVLPALLMRFSDTR